jgi:hypothetical protein
MICREVGDEARNRKEGGGDVCIEVALRGVEGTSASFRETKNDYISPKKLLDAFFIAEAG